MVKTVGPGVTSLVSGDHVVLSFDSCPSCANCESAHTAYCDTFFARNLVGLGLDGSTPVTDAAGKPVAARWFGQSSFATHALAAARNAVKVPKGLPLELLGPLGCGIQTGAGSVLTALGVRAGSSIVVFGAGGVGLSAIMAVKVAGAATVIAVDLNPARLKLAQFRGATHVVDGADENLLETLQKITGNGAQYSLDTIGVPAVISTAIRALRPTGTCGLVGVQQGDRAKSPQALAQRCRIVLGCAEEGGLRANKTVAAELGIWPQTVTKWRKQFLDKGIEGLGDEPGRVGRALSPMSRWRRCWWRHCSGSQPMPRAGRGRRWPPRAD